ncbi:hypothetical protein IWW48_004726 [Coemansia sp. RSA 1200]|nr:hypothetical protein IWW48_004726 [Coemansia sp. RSA 1200]
MDTTPLPPPVEDFGLVDYESPKMTEHVVFKANQPDSHSETENYTAAEEEEEENYDGEEEPSELVLVEETEKYTSEEYVNGGELESSHHQQSNTEAENSISDSQNQQLIDYDETMFAAEASGADDNDFTEYAPGFGEDYSASAVSASAVSASAVSASAVPEVWVHSENEWMIYLGPDQLSFDYDYQMELYTMPLIQLIDALHTDILLREDTELALEFPSLGLVIDRRDDACIDLSLQQLYNCHVAAVAMGTISIDLVNSPYFIHPPHTTIAATESGSASASFTPSHESFAFIIHTRPSVSSTLARIMQVVEEYNNNNNSTSNDNDRELESTVPGLSQPGEPGAVAENKDKADEDEEQVEVTDDIQSPNGNHYERKSTTAELLADNDDAYEEDEDEDFVADEEEEGDHVLDDDAVGEEDDFEEDDDEEEEDEDDDAALDIENGDGDRLVNEEEEEADVNVDEEGASPARKRTTDDIIDLVDIDGDAEEKNAGASSSSEPVSKKPKSDDDAEIIQVDS